jgi:hypothetical protein
MTTHGSEMASAIKIAAKRVAAYARVRQGAPNKGKHGGGDRQPCGTLEPTASKGHADADAEPHATEPRLA